MLLIGATSGILNKCVSVLLLSDEIIHWLLCALFAFLRKQIVDIPGVSLHLAKQYIGSCVIFL